MRLLPGMKLVKNAHMLAEHFSAYTQWRGAVASGIGELRKWLQENEIGDAQSDLRLQYLLVLRYLVDEGRISWKPQHTDRDYQAQLKDEDERLRFGRLSFIFKWVWYGEAMLDRGQYERLSVAFIDFRSRRAA